MQCPYATKIPVKPCKKNDYQRGMISMPCGHCEICRRNNAKQWAVRVYHESRLYLNNTFVTLTYDDEHLPLTDEGIPTLKKNHMSEFMKRLRDYIYPSQVRFFGCGEYGDTFSRPHMHLAIFGLDPLDERLVTDYNEVENGYCVEYKPWKLGRVHVGFVTPESSSYVAGYELKKLKPEEKEKQLSRGIQPVFSLMSRRPGIGAAFCDAYKDEFIERGMCSVEGQDRGLPRFYRNRMEYQETDEYWDRLIEQVEKNKNQRLKDFSSVENMQQVALLAANQQQQTIWNMDFMRRFEDGKV